MPRPNRTVAALCIAVIALAAFVPGVFSLDHAWYEAQWILLPEDRPAVVEHRLPPGRERLVRLLSLLPSRAPPLVAIA